MSPDSPNPQCEVLLQLQANLDDLTVALRKAHDILSLTAESPDTMRRRRNSIKRWNEIYSIAYEKLAEHTRNHKCAPAD